MAAAASATNPDEPRISISDVTKAEGRKNYTTLFTFTVTFSAAYDQPVTMSFTTANSDDFRRPGARHDPQRRLISHRMGTRPTGSLGELVVQVQPARGGFAADFPDVGQVVAGLPLLGGAGQEVGG